MLRQRLQGRPAAVGVVAALQNRALEVAPCSTDVASAGTSAAFNAGIGGGALGGGLLLPAFGVRARHRFDVTWPPRAAFPFALRAGS